MASIPEGYREVPEEDRIKAKSFFDRARTPGNTGNFEFCIELFLLGLALDPDAVPAHQELRDYSMKRKASGGKPVGFFEAMKLRRGSKDDKQNMLNAEKLLAYDPGNTDYMVSLMQNAHRGGYFDTVLWIGPILQRANADSKKPEFSKFIILRDVYKSLNQWQLATDATNYALRMRPEDMELQTELKNLGAMSTMKEGNYGEAGSFRDSVKDMGKQARLMFAEKDVQDMGGHAAMIAEAEAEYKADPEDIGKTMRLVDALEKTENPDYESRAIEILQKLHDQTKQYRYRMRIGAIQIKQMSRMERGKRAALAADPTNADLRQEYTQLRKEQTQFELDEFQAAAREYPTEMRYKFETGKRMFNLGMHKDAIPVLQQARNDPKYRVDAGLLLACSFLEAGYADEADETLANLIRDYPIQGDTKSKDMFYWRARTLEQKNQKAESLQHYSKVAQWDFNYRDVQARMKKLKGV